MAFDLSDYVPVAERISLFYAANPDGRIVSDPPQVVTLGNRLFVAATARAYRSPDDPCPCQGNAWEPFPGQTPYTKDSEAMNAETSAIGRAIAAAGIGTSRSMASADEVRARQAPTPAELDEAAKALGWDSEAARKKAHDDIDKRARAIPVAGREPLRLFRGSNGWPNFTPDLLDEFERLVIVAEENAA